MRYCCYLYSYYIRVVSWVELPILILLLIGSSYACSLVTFHRALWSKLAVNEEVRMDVTRRDHEVVDFTRSRVKNKT